MEIAMLLLGVITAIITMLGIIFQLVIPIAKGEIKLKSKPPFVKRAKIEIDSIRATKSDKPLPLRLFSIIWNYPLAGGAQSSWAVKESGIIKGELEYARQNPGLGVALLSIDMALNTFGQSAIGRINNCIDWGLSKVQSIPPYFMLVDHREEIISSEERKTDFRHTLALGIIIAKARADSKYLKYYINSALELQKEDGNWDPGHGITLSEVFTVFYAIEFLTICKKNPRVSKGTQKKIVKARNKAVNWLIENSAEDGLWKSGVIKSPWDSLFATAWVLRRLAPLKEIRTKSWLNCVERAVHTMIADSLNPDTWNSSNDIQRLRVETRICSAITLTEKEVRFNGILKEKVAAYTSETRERIRKELSRIPDKELDLSTALFAVDFIIPSSDIKKWALIISKMEPNNSNVNIGRCDECAK
jgi:hypothetical protein